MSNFDEAYRKVRRLRGSFHAQRKDVAQLRKQYEVQYQKAVREAKAAFKPFDRKAAEQKWQTEQRKKFVEYRRLKRLYQKAVASQGKEAADQQYEKQLRPYKRPPSPPQRPETRGRPRTTEYVPSGKPSLPKRIPFGTIYQKSLKVVQNDKAESDYTNVVRALGLNVTGDLKAEQAKALSAVWSAYIAAFDAPEEAEAFCERRGITRRVDDPNSIRRLARLFVGEPICMEQSKPARWICDDGLVHRISRIVEKLAADEVAPSNVGAWLQEQGGISAVSDVKKAINNLQIRQK